MVKCMKKGFATGSWGECLRKIASNVLKKLNCGINLRFEGEVAPPPLLWLSQCVPFSYGPRTQARSRSVLTL